MQEPKNKKKENTLCSLFLEKKLLQTNFPFAVLAQAWIFF
jgi:hypothetical protein